MSLELFLCFFFFNDPAPPEIYTFPHQASLPIPRHNQGGQSGGGRAFPPRRSQNLVRRDRRGLPRSEEHTSELQSHLNLVCRLLLEKKKNVTYQHTPPKRSQPLTRPIHVHCASKL